MPRTITHEQLHALLAGQRPVVVCFGAAWCGPCRAMEPALSSLEAVLDGRASVVKIDTDASREAAREYEVRIAPTFIVFLEGKPVATKVGALTAPALIDWARAHCGVEHDGLLPLFVRRQQSGRGPAG